MLVGAPRMLRNDSVHPGLSRKQVAIAPQPHMQSGATPALRVDPSSHGASSHCPFPTQHAAPTPTPPPSLPLHAQIGATRSLRDDLSSQLERVAEERARAKQQRDALVAALEAKRGPLAQARERLAVGTWAGVRGGAASLLHHSCAGLRASDVGAYCYRRRGGWRWLKGRVGSRKVGVNEGGCQGSKGNGGASGAGAGAADGGCFGRAGESGRQVLGAHW